MKVLVLGSGGREHAIAWKIAQSSLLSELFIAPGNAGTGDLAQNIPIDVNDFQSIKKFVIENHINMVVVGPEDPLVNGIYDFFKTDPELMNVAVIGPSKEAARLEGSKEYAKEFMIENNIPTAKYQSFTMDTIEEANTFIESLDPPYVLKADGLAAGKGVLILEKEEEAKAELANMLNGKFGKASNTVVVEEFLKGIELSVFFLTDGESYIILPEAKDYKRIGEGDTGLNTGGMGAVSPVPFADTLFMKKVEDRIIKPTVYGLQKRGIDYHGFVFLGLMNVDGDPYVIEYNVRMGDPESEVVIPRIKTDLLCLFDHVQLNKLNEAVIDIDTQTATTVMLVSNGYPEKYEKLKKIKNLDKVEGSVIFHAGTKLENSEVLTNGGRVLAVTSYGIDKNEALAKSYLNANIIDFSNKVYRKDIGFDLKE